MQAAIRPFITPEKALVCTLTSNGYKFFTLNLVRLLQKAGVPWKLCIVCADRASYRFFRQEGIPCLLATKPFPDGGPTSAPTVTPFGCRTFQQLNLKKLELLAELAGGGDPEAAGPDYVVYMDGDIAVYADFLPDLVERLKAAPQPILLQCDEQTRVDCSGTVGAGGGLWCPAACTGFIGWRRGPTVPLALFQVTGTAAAAAWRACPEDQVFVNRRLRDLGIGFGTLPRDKYPNGMFVRLRGAGEVPGAFLLHYNWRVGDMKRASMIANGDWVVPY